MTIAISSTKRARWCLPSWNALPTTIKKVVMTSVTSGCADWQQRPSNTLKRTECITEYLTTIDYGKQIDYTRIGGETEILSSLLTGRQRQGCRLCGNILHRTRPLVRT